MFCIYTIHVISFRSSHRPTKWILLPPLCRGENRDSERLSNLPSVTQIKGGRARIQAQVIQTLNLPQLPECYSASPRVS